VIFNILAGSMIGVFIGARLATKINPKKLDNIVFVFLIFLGIFMITHSLVHFNHLELTPIIRIILGSVLLISAFKVFSKKEKRVKLEFEK
jgi:hypothetical protein